MEWINNEYSETECMLPLMDISNYFTYIKKTEDRSRNGTKKQAF